MSQTLSSPQHSVTLPNYAEDGFTEQIAPNWTKNYTLDNSLYVDFINNRKGWTLTYDMIDKATYLSIKQLYNDQFQYKELLTFVDSELGYNVPVLLTLPADHTIKWNKSVVSGLVLTLEIASPAILL